MAQNSRLLQWILCTIALGILVHLIYPLESYDYAGSWNIVYGYLDFENQSALIMSFIKWMIPQMVLLFFWGDYVERRLIKHLDYILTRTNRLGNYLAGVYLRLFAVTGFTCAILYMITAITSASSADQFQIDVYTVENMLTYLIYLFLILMMVNAVSIAMNAVFAVLAVVGVQVVLFEITKGIFDGVISQTLYKFLPTSNVLFYYNAEQMRGNGIGGILFLLTIIAVVFVLNIVFLKKKEIM